MRKNVYHIIRDAAEKWPDQPAIHDEFGTVTFSELFDETERLRQWLLSEGVKSGMGVGLMCRNSRYFISGLFAAAGVGAVVLPLSHQLKKPEIDEITNATGLHFILDDYSGVDPLETERISEFKALKHLNSFRLQSTGKAFDQPLASHISDPVFIRYSSGTTGKSKGVVIGHQSVYERIDAANELLRLGREDVVLWVLPMAFHFVVSVVLYVRVGAAIAIARDFLAETVAETCESTSATLLYASPMHLKLLANFQGEMNLTSLKMVISTSTAISPEDIERFTSRTGLAVSQAYGIIEIGLPIVNDHDAIIHPEAVGHALPAYEVSILSDDLSELPDGVTGHLAISGPGMFDGYLSPPLLRRDVLQGGKWFMTGDLAVKDQNGLITIKGRKKSMINVSGNKAFPEEIEAVLNAYPGVKISRVFGGKHPLLGEVVEAEVVAETADLHIEKLLRFCRERLSTYKVPQRVYIVDKISMTTTGKIRRT